MKRIAVISFREDIDVSKGLKKLFDLYPESTALIPVVNDNSFVQSAIKTAKKSKVKFNLFFTDSASIDEIANAEDITLCNNPFREIAMQLTSEDVLAIVWDESPESRIILHSLEDFALETWNISNGLEKMEIDYTDEDSIETLYEQMNGHLHAFIDSLTEYVVTSVIEVLTVTIAERLREEEGKKDISPFED